MSASLKKGILIEWNEEQGFGFIQADTVSQDVLLHVSDLKHPTRHPKVGDTIYFHLVLKGGKAKAQDALTLGARSKRHPASPSIHSSSSPPARSSSSPSTSTRSVPPARLSSSPSTSTRSVPPARSSSSPPARPSPSAHLSLAPRQQPAPRTNPRFSLAWTVTVFCVAPFLGILDFTRDTGNYAPFVLYPLMSGLTFLAYVTDKSRAQTGRGRIPELNLHLLELVGGWIGGLIAQRIIHHKSSKKSYQLVFWGIVWLHQIGWVLWLLSG